jgi:TonB family protein
MVDGKQMTETEVNKIDPESIESISVLKDKSASAIYGYKGKDGVIIITTKKNSSLLNSNMSEVKVTGNGKDQKTAEDKFVIVEEMPQFPGGGKDAMVAWINSNIKYPAEAFKSKITGTVVVNFLVSSTGKVKNVKVSKAVNPLLDAEARRVVSSMPDWKPGSQAGKPVDVQMMIPVEFRLN